MNAGEELRALMREYVGHTEAAARLARHLAAEARDPLLYRAKARLPHAVDGREAARRLAELMGREIPAACARLREELRTTTGGGDPAGYEETVALARAVEEADEDFERARAELARADAELARRLAGRAEDAPAPPGEAAPDTSPLWGGR